jgi:hypothetical protein
LYNENNMGVAAWHAPPPPPQLSIKNIFFLLEFL